MYRGFKTRAEELSLQQRENLGLASEAPLPATQLAKSLGILVATLQEVPDVPADISRQLTRIDPHSWSAFTIPVHDTHLIIHNSIHSPGRQESNLMHEIAHVLCNHNPGGIIQPPGFPFPMRTFNREQEDEATWLGGCLQLPRTCLLWGVSKGLRDDEIASHFGASVPLVLYRRRVTGVDRQLSRAHSIQSK